MTVTPVSTAQHCISHSPNPEMSSDVCVSLESNEDKVDPERDELESPSVSIGFETPGQQRHSIWETGRTTAGGFLTAGVGSNLGKHTSPTTERAGARARTKITTTSGFISSPTKHVGTRAGTAATPAKPSDNQLAKKTSNLTPVGKERRHRYGTRL